jgi:hypothetical protein
VAQDTLREDGSTVDIWQQQRDISRACWFSFELVILRCTHCASEDDGRCYCKPKIGERQAFPVQYCHISYEVDSVPTDHHYKNHMIKSTAMSPTTLVPLSSFHPSGSQLPQPTSRRRPRPSWTWLDVMQGTRKSACSGGTGLKLWDWIVQAAGGGLSGEGQPERANESFQG